VQKLTLQWYIMS